MTHEEHWAKDRVVARLWYCGDDECDCTQPVVERVSPNREVGFPCVRYERLWEGDFHSRRSTEEGRKDERDLLEAALRYDAVMTDFKPLHLAKDSETLEVLVVFKNGLGEIQVGPTSLVPVPFHDCFVPYDGKFTHYKGGKYALLHHARRVGTNEEVVVYRSLETSFVWVRPRAMFFGTLENGTRRFAPE